MNVLNLTNNDLRTPAIQRRQPSGFVTNGDIGDKTANDLKLLLAAIQNVQNQVVPIETTITKTVGEQITFSYDNLSGTNFSVGEVITGATSSATGEVVSNVAGVLVLDTLTGIFENGEEIEGEDSNTADITTVPASADGAVVVTYDNLAVGVFAFGETVTDTITGATGVVVSDNGADTLILKDVTGDFNDNDTLEGGTSGTTADVNGATVYTTIDLTNAVGAGLFILASDNTHLAIGAFTNYPDGGLPFKVEASGSTVFVIVNTSDIKTDGGADIVLKGTTGDFATFAERDSTVKETGAVIYAS